MQTRNEPGDRVIKVLRVFLIIIGLAAMAVVMWMTGRFGWSLQDADADRWASAALHVLGDAAGAALVAISAIMLGWTGWRWKGMGGVALLCALTLVAYSIVSVYGFMSTRIAHLEGHKNVVAFEKGDLDWKNKTSIRRDVPRNERLNMRAEAKTATEQLKKSLSFIPDAQAAGIAAWLDTTTERVQRGLVVITSCIGQLIKVSCLFFGFSLWSQRIADASAARDDASSGNKSGGGGRKLRVVPDAPDAKTPAYSASMQPEYASSPAAIHTTMQRSAPGVSRMGAGSPSDLLEYLDDYSSGHGPRRPQVAIARDFGVSQPTVSRQLRRAQERANRKAARMNIHGRLNGYADLGGGMHASAAG